MNLSLSICLGTRFKCSLPNTVTLFRVIVLFVVEFAPFPGVVIACVVSNPLIMNKLVNIVTVIHVNACIAGILPHTCFNFTNCSSCCRSRHGHVLLIMSHSRLTHTRFHLVSSRYSSEIVVNSLQHGKQSHKLVESFRKATILQAVRTCVA